MGELIAIIFVLSGIVLFQWCRIRSLRRRIKNAQNFISACRGGQPMTNHPRSPKFRVGQVVGMVHADDFYKVVAIQDYKSDKFAPAYELTDGLGLFHGEDQLRPLTKKEAGR